jgi:hypothetical protein
VANRGKVCAAGGVAKTTKHSTQHSSGITKWKNVSFKGPANAFFKSLHAEGKDVWRTAYNCYCPHFSFHIKDLAEHFFGGGRLFPPFAGQSTGWPPLLISFYSAVHECVRYAASLVGSSGAIQTRIIDKLNLANNAMTQWVQANRSALSEEEYSKLRSILERYNSVSEDAGKMAYPRMHLSQECVYYDGKEQRRDNLYDF